MSIEGLKIIAETVDTVGGKMGLIKIEFTWKGFGKITETSRIEIGDVFIGGFYLSEGELLRIKLPLGFEILDVRPTPDGRESDYVEWKGRMVFSNGEPYLVMMPAKAPPQTIPIQDNSLFLLYAVSGFTATIPITYLIHKKRSSRRPKESDLDTIISIIRKHGKVVYQSQIVRESGLSKSTVSTILKTLESEGRVVRTREGRENMVKLIR